MFALLWPAIQIVLLSLVLPAVHAQKTGNTSPSASPRIRSIVSALEKTRILYEAALSPDGRYIAWAAASDGGSVIEIASTSSPAHPLRLSAGSGPGCIEDNLAWAPDSEQLAFTSDCQGNGQADIYLSGVTGGSPGSPSLHLSPPRRLTHLHGGADALAFSPDGKQIGFLYVEGATRRPGGLDAIKPPSGVIGSEEIEIQRVAAVRLPSGETRKLTPANLHVYEFDWSPDSSKLAYVAAPPPGEDNWWVAKLYLQSLSPAPAKATPGCSSEDLCTEPKPILDPSSAPGRLHGMQIAVPRWSPDGGNIALIGGLMSDQGATGGDVYLVSTSGGHAPVDITPNSASTAVWLTWIDHDHLIVTSTDGGSSRVDSLQLATPDAAAAPAVGNTLLQVDATLGDGRLDGSLSLSADGTQAAFIESSFAQPPEIYAGPLTPAGPRQITHFNDGLEPMWGKAESIHWKDGAFDIQGWLLYPARYDPAKKYPLIVSVHGGPSAAVVPMWPGPGYNAAVFSPLGYFVLMPNPRGSFGQGEAFTLANRKDFGHGDLRDILAGVDAVSTRFPIDRRRIGITGWSYGGFMTMFAVTQTRIFRAAVAGAGISNWQSYYGENSIDQWMIPFFGASVYDDPGVYAKSSAINFIRNVKTPTLLVVGDRDGECPAPQSFEFWHALRAEHVPTRLVVYPDEGHRFVFPEHRRDVLERALAWFEQYMPPEQEAATSASQPAAHSSFPCCPLAPSPLD